MSANEPWSFNYCRLAQLNSKRSDPPGIVCLARSCQIIHTACQGKGMDKPSLFKQNEQIPKYNVPIFILNSFHFHFIFHFLFRPPLMLQWKPFLFFSCCISLSSLFSAVTFTHHTLRMSTCFLFHWVWCCQCFMTYSLILSHAEHQYLIGDGSKYSLGLLKDSVCMHNKSICECICEYVVCWGKTAYVLCCLPVVKNKYCLCFLQDTIFQSVGRQHKKHKK